MGSRRVVGMQHRTRDARLTEVPVEHIAVISEMVQRDGIVIACKRLKLSRTAVLGILATGRGMPGSASILREAIARRGTQA